MDLILYNPLSKNSKSNVYTHKLIQQYKKDNIPFRIKSILKIDDIRLYLEEKEQYENVILLGGDGTINRFVNNVADYNVKQDVYLKSNGSGNDFLRSLKLNDKSPQHIIKASYDNGVSNYFINAVGMGADGLIMATVNSAEKKGKLRYMYYSLKSLIKFVPEPVTVTVDGEVHNFKNCYMAVVNNGKYVGGGMKMAPDADISDENLDVYVLHTIKKIFILPLFFTIYFGKHIKFTKYVTYFKAKKVNIKFDTPQISEADGETVFDVTSMDVESSQKTIHLKYYENKKSA